jgi:NAD(P)-dependent dehydrogenase (short-subunit alcohol dehydrogenase family)
MHSTPKVALVTGASSGFGLATTVRLSAQGFRVFGTSRAPLHNEASSVELLPLDVTSEVSVQTCVQTILGHTGRIDLHVNKA